MAGFYNIERPILQYRSQTRYEKRAANYRAMLVIASIVIWLES